MARARAPSSAARAAFDTGRGIGTLGLGHADLRDGFFECGLGDGGGIVADAPRAVAAETVAAPREQHEVGLVERELHRGAPTGIDQHHPREHAPQRVLQSGHAGADAVDQRTRPGWREPRLRGRCELVDHEQETARLAGVETLDRVRGGLAALHDDGAERLAERGRHRRFDTGLDLQQVDQRTDDPGNSGELLAPGRGARGIETEVERVGAGTPARRLRFGRAPRFVGGAQHGFGTGHVARSGGGAAAIASSSSASSLRNTPASATSVSSTPASAAAASSRSTPRCFSATSAVEAASAFTRRLDPHQPVGERVVAHHREGVLGVEHGDVEVAQTQPQLAFALRVLGACVAQAFDARLQAADLVPGEMEADRAQLLDQSTVAARRVGLTLQRRELAAHLAEEVVEPKQVAFGALQPALGPLAPLPELQDPGGFLDDAATVFGPRVEHRVELTLPDDHVLLPADPGVGEQVLDVEQPAGRAVELVLGVTLAEQRAGDRDLGELDREQRGRVVDRERHLGPPQRGAVGRAREDDVVHLAAAERARPLGAEHPRHRVDEVRLPGPVRAHHHGHAGLELEGRLVGERLESSHRQ